LFKPVASSPVLFGAQRFLSMKEAVLSQRSTGRLLPREGAANPLAAHEPDGERVRWWKDVPVDLAVVDSVLAMAIDRESFIRRRTRGLPSLATALSLLAALCAWGCGDPTAPAPASAERLSQERDIAEAVLRDFMSRLPENPSSPPVSFQAVCISVDHQDPVDSFLSRFSAHAPPVKRGSACATTSADSLAARIIDSSTGADAIKLDVYAVTWETGRHVTVDAAYQCGALCAAVYLYDLVLDHDGWKVDRRTLITIA
jgi:hypothetical protein